jgi:hypothetical protein
MSSSASTSGATSTPLMTRFLISPSMVVSTISTPRIVTWWRSECWMVDPLSSTVVKREPCMSARSNSLPVRSWKSMLMPVRLNAVADIARRITRIPPATVRVVCTGRPHFAG